MKLSCLAGSLPVAIVSVVTGVAWGQGAPPPGGGRPTPKLVFEEISTMKDSFMPYGDLVTRGDGAFYCVAEWWVGGKGRAILRLVPGEEPEVLHAFSTKQDAKPPVDGYNPNTPVIFGADGALYGGCSSGGANGNGMIYRLSVDGVFSVVCDLVEPMSGMQLVASPDGMIYGTTAEGGPNGGGTLFSMNPNGGALTTLCEFQQMPSERPLEGEQSPFSCPTDLAVGADGKIYGRFEYGGVMSAGSRRRSYGGLFRYDGPGAFTVLHEEVPVSGISYLRELVPTEDGFLVAGRTMMHHLAFNGDFTVDQDLYPMAWGPKKPVYVSGTVYGLIGEFTTEAPLIYRYGPGVEAKRIHDFSEDYDRRFINLMAANDGMLYGMATLPEGYVSQGKRGTRSVGTRVFRMKPSDAPANYVPFANADAAWLPAKAAKDGTREVIVDVLKNDRDMDGDVLTLTALGPWEGEGSAEIIPTPKGRRIRVVVSDSDPKSRLLAYEVSDLKGGVATGYLAVQSQATGTFRGEASGDGISAAAVTVVLGKNHTLKATAVLDGVSYTGKGLLDVDDTADVGLWAKGDSQGVSLHLELSRGSDQKVTARVVKGGVVRTWDCAPVVK